MNDPTQKLLDEQLVYRLERLDSIDGWWAWALLITLVASGFWWTVRLYRRDVHELPTVLSASLITLRLFVLIALIVYFLQPERRTQQRVGRTSEAVVLVDTSQSMSLAAGDEKGSVSRIEVAAKLVGDSSLLDELATQHRVTVYLTGSDQEPQQVLVREQLDDALSRRPAKNASATEESVVNPSLRKLRIPIWLGTLLMILASSSLIKSGIEGWRTGVQSAQRWVLCGVLCAIIGGTALSVVVTVGASYSMLTLFGFRSAEVDTTTTDKTKVLETEVSKLPEFVADGQRSPLGDALLWISRHHDPATLATVLVFTDGQNNGGASLDTAGRDLARISVPVYSIGLGSAQPPTNVRVVDLESPPRVYPGDRFAISATLQAVGPLDQDVELQLLDALDADPWQPEIMETRKIKLPSDGTPIDVDFELDPSAVGRRKIGVRLVAAPGEQNQTDNELSSRYEVIARRLRVLAMAGGPTREYQFVRNLLHRDKDVTLDVWLQSGENGMSQDASELLTDFPSTAEDLFEYDVILAFDPDWDRLTAAQVELLDRWVAEQAGGLVMVAGPVFTPRLAAGRSDQKALLRSLMPVTLGGRLLAIDEGRFAGEEPWALAWTDERRREDFLAPSDSMEESLAVWHAFSGFYGFFATREPKPGATVYARYSDPTTATDGQLPILMASQFYGAGRSFFLGSGELWRLRTEGDAYFDRIYTKLVRWAGEGRLLRDSNRGFLLVDPPRAIVGDTISIRAVLLNEQFQPMEQAEVDAQILEPGRGVRTIKLRRLEGQPRGGTYAGQFVVRFGGQHEVRIELGDITNRQVLRDSIQVRLPTMELERPRRNDADLLALAELTTGKYLPLDESVNSNTSSLVTNLISAVIPRPQETVLPGMQDRDFQERRNAGVLWCVACAMIIEWVIRRLNRLA